MKKLVSMLLVVVMVLSLAACQKKNTPTPTTTDAPSQGPTQGADDNTPTPEAKKEYTFNYALSVFPTNWNPHTYQTETDNSDMLAYLTDGFYTFDYNETKDGYKVVPAMLAKEAEDVTAQYIGKYGLVEGDKAKAYKLTLRTDLKWEDGTAIKAQDFVTSAKLLLNPEAQNYRADSLYSGNMPLYNAKNYLYQGQYAYAEFVSANYGDDEYVALSDFGVNAEGQYTCPKGDVAVNLKSGGNWGSDSLEDYAGAGYLVSTKADYDALAAAADKDGIVKLTAELYMNLCNCIAELHGYANADAYAADAGDYAYQEAQEMAICGASYPALDFAEVGIVALSDTEFVYVSEKAIQGFDLKYALTGTWLVNEELYKKCESVKDGVYQNSYGTSAETTISYGAYKLVSFQNDKQYVLERNDNFYDITPTTYQATKIQYDLVAEAATRLEMFLNGKLDSYALQSDDMKDYQSSDYTYYTSEPSTFFIALNPDMDALTTNQKNAGEHINKTILTIKEFRQALSYALDRKAFALAVSPTNNAAFSLYSDLIISNPDEGIAYRTLDEAKKVLVSFWGLSDEIGEGKMYADMDEAIASVTGYNLAMAKEYFDKAYDKAIAEGLMTAEDTVEILIGTPNGTSNFYVKGNEFLVNCYTDAVKGTKLEGKLRFTLDNTLGNSFGDKLRENSVDMLFGVGWSGSALDPYNLMEAYTKDSYRYNRCWDTTKESMTVTLNGVAYTASVWDWNKAIMGDTVSIVATDGKAVNYSCGSTDGKPEERVVILAALEGAVLETFEMIPMIDSSSAGLKGMQFEYCTEDYIYGVGRGGVKYNTFNYSDDEWEKFVTEQGGTLNYK